MQAHFIPSSTRSEPSSVWVSTLIPPCAAVLLVIVVWLKGLFFECVQRETDRAVVTAEWRDC